MYLHHLSFLNTNMAQVVEILPHLLSFINTMFAGDLALQGTGATVAKFFI